MDADPTTPRPRRFRALSAALILLAMLAAAYLLAPQTIGEQARRTLVGVLQEHYVGTQVSIGSGRFASDVGLILEDVEFAVPATATKVARSIVRIDRLVVETDFSREKITAGEMPISAKRIIAVGLEVDAWQEADGKWSLNRLFPPPKLGPGCPRLEIHNSRLRIYRERAFGERDEIRPLEFDHLQVAVNVVPESALAPAAYQFSLRTSSTFTDQILVTGTASSQSIRIQGAVKTLHIDPVLTSRAPFLCPDACRPLSGLTASGDLQFVVQRNIGLPINFVAKWNCSDGRYEHPALPQPIDKIRGIVTMRPTGAIIEQAQVNLGESICRVSGATQGWSAGADVNLRLTATNLMLNERFAASLPQAAQVSLDRIRPRGLLDVDSRVERSDGKWSADAVVDLHGIDVNVDKFPYPVSQLIGKVNFRHSQVWTEQLSGRLGNQRVNVSFLKSEIGKGQPSWVRMDADGPIAIDSTLLNSLTPRGEPQSKLEKFVRSLNPRGTVHLQSGQWNTSPTGQKSQRLDLHIATGSLRYSGFPYALYDVSGQVEVRDDIVNIVNFQTKNGDNATINCEGKFENLTSVLPRSPQGDWRVGLHFQGWDLPLDETIRAALPSTAQQTWDSLAPAGVLNFIDVQVGHAATSAAPQLTIAATQQARTVIDSRTVSLRPTMIPYRLDIMQGAVRYDGEQVTIESLDARHDATRLAADGRCVRTSNGQWRLDMNVRSGSRLHPDSELVNSLPNQVRDAFHRLQLRGPLSIRGSTRFMLPDDQHPDPTIDWGLTIQLEGNRIGDVGPVHDLRGEIMVQGRRDGQAVNADGMVNIDSIHVDDKQITAIRGPFAIRDDRLLLGETIAVISKQSSLTAPKQTISPIEGRMFGGVVSLSGDVLLSNGNFDVAMGIREGDVATMLADLGQTHSTTVGNVDGQVRLEGTLGIAHLLKGTGSGKLTGANLYEVPVLVQVFNLLSVKPSEAVAFTDGEVRFAVYGEDVTFSQIQLWGDLIALHGSGTMSRSKDVDLTFNTRVSPQNVWSKATRPFGDNQYTLWTINVKGPLADPIIERRTLNAVNETLERLFPGIAEPVQQAGPISTRFGNLKSKVFK